MANKVSGSSSALTTTSAPPIRAGDRIVQRLQADAKFLKLIAQAHEFTAASIEARAEILSELSPEGLNSEVEKTKSAVVAALISQK